MSHCSTGLGTTDGCVPIQPLSIGSSLRPGPKEEAPVTFPVPELSAQLNTIAVAMITVVTVGGVITFSINQQH